MKLFQPKRDWYDNLTNEKTYDKDNPMQKKRVSLIKSYEEPVLPQLCKILFISMLVLTFIMILLELVSFYRYHTDLGIHHLLANLSTSTLLSWSCCGALLILSSFLGIRINIKHYWKKKTKDRILNQTEEDKKRNICAIHRLNLNYRIYIYVTISGFILWFSFYLLIV